MSGAACAKIIIDNYGAFAGAAADASTVGEASCEALMQLYEDPSLSKDERKSILELSAKCCYWGDEIREWTKEIRDFTRKLAEKHI